MKTEVIHCKNMAAVKAAGDRYVYVGRDSDKEIGKWGNPYSHQRNTRALIVVATRELAVSSYETYLLDKPELMDSLHELKGKVLGCWCHPKACHGHILARYADRIND